MKTLVCLLVSLADFFTDLHMLCLRAATYLTCDKGTEEDIECAWAQFEANTGINREDLFAERGHRDEYDQAACPDEARPAQKENHAPGLWAPWIRLAGSNHNP